MRVQTGTGGGPRVAFAHEVYYLRHGETSWNFDRRLQGQSDIPLNETGRAQARRHGRTMARLGLDWSAFDFWVSPLSRTRETFEIVRDELGQDIAPKLDDRLREGAFGRWEGMTWEEILAAEPENHHTWLRQSWTTAPHGGETYGDIGERVRDWAGEVTRPAVVVAHGGVSRVIRAMYLDLPKHDLVEIHVPQDRFMRLAHGRVDFI